ARLAHTERGLPRPINDSDGRLTPCRAGAVKLVGQPPTHGQAGENAMRFPHLPTGRRLTHKLHSTPQQHGMILISRNGEITSRLYAFSLFFPESCPNNRDRRNAQELTSHGNNSSLPSNCKGNAFVRAVCGRLLRNGQSLTTLMGVTTVNRH